MPESSWPENDSFNELESLSSLIADLSQLPDSDEPASQPNRRDGRRRKAAVVLVIIWSGTIALHLATWGSWFVLGLTTLMGIHAVRFLFARPIPVPEPLSDTELATSPLVSIMVAAKNEEAVIGRLVKMLCSLDYPDYRYEVWVIDDNSTDKTPVLLEQLTQKYEQLRVFHRPVGSAGGKSGALNQVLPLTRGEIIAVFDADAQVPADLLRRVLPLFERQRVGAVQVRKAISNLSRNLWIRGQVAEMALDSHLQQQRIAINGIGELRGNGQFVRRAALEQCGGWNEETITDDLDLTIRLHLERWDIDFMMFPAVEEEGVTRAIALWHQRNRWAEGGYQRYLDYWQPILQNRMGTRKTLDLFMFLMIQYVLPTAMVPDLLMALIRNRTLLLSPLTGLTRPLFVLGMLLGLKQIRRIPAIAAQKEPEVVASEGFVQASRFSSMQILLQALLGSVYMFHWLPVVASMTARISIRPKRLKWVKTVHKGATDLAVE
ncbi:glycosyltransferase family 2 protein [Kovacikia minuta CCNUW1]|uniref:glycosyltransferase n=1 Tax=Kovacikia minuta TaxID=2931930 RepID=UPI001CC9ABA8|nr:glycosyltransferase family 2 protein [Kovacikia minuta]UBF29241.1 glycosyltransferase family 2 protein [Kovacikia minuta CCNUW1]